MDIDGIAKQVQENCELSDAKHWGSYTICGLLIMLMDLYRWSEGIDSWVKIENPELMDWVGEKEEKWNKIRENDYNNIVIDGTEYDPFDADSINEILEPEEFVYGAGYVAAMKPSFFLAKKEESRTEDGHKIFILGRELARDLVTTPALLQGEKIFVRTQPARSFMWGKIEEFKFTGKGLLKHAFAYYGIDIGNVDAEEVDRVAREELESYIHHEIGEAEDMIFPDEKWEEIVSSFPLTPLEKFARAVKDILADTNEHGTLRYIIDKEKEGSLGFYVALIWGFRKMIFPEIVTAFESFRERADWGVIEAARKTGHENASRHAKRLIEMYDSGSSQKEIEEELIQPFLT
jgi:hypothetical protein